MSTWSTWGDFQSLFQLSIALNTAFAAFYDFLGETPGKKAKEAREWSQRGRRLKSDWATLRQNDPSTKGETSALEKINPLITSFLIFEKKKKKVLKDNTKINVAYLRWLCLICAVIGLIFLSVSSLYYGGRINVSFQVVSFALYAPFLIGIVAVIIFSVKTITTSTSMSANQVALELEEKKFFAAEAQQKRAVDRSSKEGS